MKTPSRFPAVGAVLVATLLALGARADDAAAPGREAGRHFRRGVALYGEADYRAALVEFRRAYELSPNASVLYNVGETEYQLQDYAAALATFERYLAESSPQDPQRADVGATMEILRARVGHVRLMTVPVGAEVTVDDRAAGKTPFAAPLRVTIGHRKLTAQMTGRTPVTKYVDVAADDELTITLEIPAPQPTTATKIAARPSPLVPDPPPPSDGGTLRTLGWISTGAFAAGSITFGVLAVRESNELKATRASFPTPAGTLAHESSLTTTYSAIADALGIAAALAFGVTLYSTVTSSHEASAIPTARVSLGPASARVDLAF
jgi:tetratricopeptide (TPR) repeat protein